MPLVWESNGAHPAEKGIIGFGFSSYPAVSHARLTMALFARRMLLAKLCLLVLALPRAASSTPMATFPGDADGIKAGSHWCWHEDWPHHFFS
jgi:hypothetical protein